MELKRKAHTKAQKGCDDMKKHLPAFLLAIVLLLVWQGIAMLIDAGHHPPSPTQIVVRLWELRDPLFLVHLPNHALLGLGF